MKISFRNLSISSKLFTVFSLFFFILIFLIFTGVSSFFNWGIKGYIIRNLEKSSSLAVDIVNSYAGVTIRKHLESRADAAIAVIRYIAEEGKQNGRSPYEVKDEASRYLLSLKVGDTGYAYVLGRDGTILVHPFEELIGSTLRDDDSLQEQLRKKDGYIEYLWQNPDDPAPRKKALFMKYYQPWGWIVSLSAYRDEFHSLVRIDELKEAIRQIRVGDRGYLMILDTEGNFLVHPFLEGQNVNTLPIKEELDLPFLTEMYRSRKGRIEYSWTDPEEGTITDKVLFYRYLSEYQWVVAASMSLDEFTSWKKWINSILAGIFLFSLLLFLFISRLLANLLTRPIYNLIRFIDNAGGTDYSCRFTYSGRDEIQDLSNHINNFLEVLQNEKAVRKLAEENNRILAQFPEGNPYPVMRISENGKILYANPVSSHLLDDWGIKADGNLPEDLHLLLKGRKESFGSLEFQVSLRVYNIMYTFFSDQNAYYLFFQDITDRKNSEYQMLMSESVFHNTMEGIAITDPEGLLQRINPAFTQITGYSSEEVLGKNPRILKSDRHDRSFYQEMWDSLLRTGTWSGELWNRRKTGEAYPEWMTINSIKDEAGELIHYVSLFRDISDIKESEEKLRHQAYHDALTGLPNRLLFQDRLAQAIRHAGRGDETLAVLFLGMDNFKNVNDGLGHNTGDLYLETIAGRLRNSCRGEDTVARLGGDEFVVLLPEMQNNRNILEIMGRIQSAINQPVVLKDQEILPSVSIGVTFYPGDGRTPELLMKNADMAMFKSKQTERGSYTLYNPEMDAQFHKRMEMEQKLRRALTNGEFRLAYQPKVEVGSKKVSGAEALIRWENPELGNVSPVEFIPLAEETGIILEVGDWVLKQALEDTREIQKILGKEFEIAVNLSARQFLDNRLLDRITTILEESEIPRERVNLEITESLAMENSEVILTVLEQISAMDMKISIDDFGTGHSSYSYLKRFKANTLKIDKSFVDELPGGAKDPAIIKNIIDLGHILDMEVVAEGVESEEQYQYLKKAGCDLIQGYFFSRPLFIEDFLSFISEKIN